MFGRARRPARTADQLIALALSPRRRRRRLRSCLAAMAVLSGASVPLVLSSTAPPSFAATAPTSPGDIATVLGNGTAGTGGDQGPAASASLAAPQFSVVDAAGDVFTSDTANNRVQEVPATSGTQFGIAMTAGDVYTIAGSSAGTSGSSGTGGPGTGAYLYEPMGLALDSIGDLYIADHENERVLELAATNHSQWNTTMTAGDLYTVAGTTGVSGSGGDSGPATSAELSGPVGVALDASNNLYVADQDNNRVQIVAAATCSTSCTFGLPSTTAGAIYTLLGSATGGSGSSGDGGAASSALLHTPSGIAIDGAGNLYVADSGNDRIQEVAATTGTDWGQPMTAGDVYTVAGVTGSAGYVGDGGPATEALLSYPTGVTLDGSGDLYVADRGNDRIQEVVASAGSQWGQSMSANDVYTVVGVTGNEGFSGDGGLASQAELSQPDGVAVDTGGNVFVTDTGNNRVREAVAVAPGIGASTIGDLVTVAGNGSTGTNGVTGQATEAELDYPHNAVTDSSGNVYFSNQNSNTVYELAAVDHTQWGTTMTAGDVYLIAGQVSGSSGSGGDNGAATSAYLSAPAGLALDSLGDLYIADGGNNRVQEIAATNHTQWGIAMTANDIYTVAGSPGGSSGASGNGTPASSSYLDDPLGVSVDGSGNLYVADSYNDRVVEIPAASGTDWSIPMTANDLYVVAGQTGHSGTTGDGNPATASYLNTPYAIEPDSSGDLYIADSSNNRVQEVAASTGTQWGQSMVADDVYTVAGSPTGNSGITTSPEPGTQALFSFVSDLKVDAQGDVFICDQGNSRIEELAAAEGAQFGQQMSAGSVYTIAGSARGANGYAGDGGPATSALLQAPPGIAVDPAGDVFIADAHNNRLREVLGTAAPLFPMTPTGIYSVAGNTTAGAAANGAQGIEGALNAPQDVITDSQGNVYIADASNNRIEELAATNHTQWGIAMTAGDLYTIAGSVTGASGSSGDGGPATSALLDVPQSVAIDPLGDLYISDFGNTRIEEVAATTHTQWGISMTAGSIYTVVGTTDDWGYSGDNGPATASLLDVPTGIAVDQNGDLFIADSNNERIQEVSATNQTQWGIAMTAGDVYTVAGVTGSVGTGGDGGLAHERAAEPALRRRRRSGRRPVHRGRGEQPGPGGRRGFRDPMGPVDDDGPRLHDRRIGERGVGEHLLARSRHADPAQLGRGCRGRCER